MGDMVSVRVELMREGHPTATSRICDLLETWGDAWTAREIAVKLDLPVKQTQRQALQLVARGVLSRRLEFRQMGSRMTQVALYRTALDGSVFDPEREGHGTRAGYENHRRHGTDPCQLCREAKRVYEREWRQRQKAKTKAADSEYMAQLKAAQKARIEAEAGL